MTHKEVQQIAKDTMEALRQNIHAGMTLDDVRAFCENKMKNWALERALVQQE